MRVGFLKSAAIFSKLINYLSNAPGIQVREPRISNLSQIRGVPTTSNAASLLSGCCINISRSLNDSKKDRAWIFKGAESIRTLPIVSGFEE